MSQSLSIPLLLQQTFALYREHRWNYLGYSAWLLIPIVGIVLVNFFENILLVSGLFIFSVMDFLLRLWVFVILTRLTFALQNKQTTDQKTLAFESVKFLFPVFLVTLLQFLVLVGGLLLLIIPGLIFFFWYAFASFTVILDGKRPLAALSASRELIRGKFFRVALAMVIGELCIMFLSSVLLAAVSVPIIVFTHIDPFTLFTPPIPLWFTILQKTIDIIIYPLLIIFGTVLFVELKKPRKQDGLDETCAIA